MGTPTARGFFIETSNGKRWEVVIDTVCGMCARGPLIFIDTKYHGKDLLDSFCHEAAHAERPELSEAEVTKLSRFLSELLWKAGYRQVPPKRRKRRKQGH